MMYLGRKIGESIIISREDIEPIVIQITHVNLHGREIEVQVGVQAANDVSVDRNEIYEAKSNNTIEVLSIEQKFFKRFGKTFKEALQEHINQGYSLYATAKHYGYTVCTLKRYAKKYGLNFPRHQIEKSSFNTRGNYKKNKVGNY